MEDHIGLIVQISIPPFLILLGWIAGRTAERRHLRSLHRREQELADMMISNVKTFTGDADAQKGATMVLGEAVIATDYLKSFLAKIRKILGGELKSYESLMQRARREAMLRMLYRARELGYDAVCNVRLDPSDIGGATQRRGAVLVAICATGTAYKTTSSAANVQEVA